jgi:hypothetical protein
MTASGNDRTPVVAFDEVRVARPATKTGSALCRLEKGVAQRGAMM